LDGLSEGVRFAAGDGRHRRRALWFVGVGSILGLISPLATLIDAASGRSLAYPVFAEAVKTRALILREMGIGRGDRVVLTAADPLGYFVDLFAVWLCGAAAVCASSSYTPSEREALARKFTPRLWIGPCAPAAIENLATASADIGGEAILPGEIEAEDLDADALILLTSGTTGAPKGIVHTLRSLQARVTQNLAHMDRADLAVGLDVLPLHFGHGLIGNCLTVLAAGGKLVVQPEPGIDGLARLGETIDRFGVTFLSSVPALWRVVLKTSRPPSGGTLRRIHVGSAPLSVAQWNAICKWSGTRRVLNMYGMTEAANWIAGHSAEQEPIADGLIGRPWGGEFKVRRDDGSLASKGRGELLIASPSLMKGYFGQPELTAQALQDGFLATGDIAEIDEYGFARLVGRQRDEINRAGLKISCVEIDLLLERHPQVRDACAFPIEDAVLGEVVGVAVASEDGSAIDVAALREWCSRNIRKEAVPARFFQLAEIPANDRGKRSREKVRELCLATAGRERVA
jgi:acyl-CoA synthetase (AMP-forming)/AMP-acid ligase II